MPVLKRLITVPHRLVDGWSFLQELMKLGKVRLKDGELGDLAGGANGLALDGLTLKPGYLLELV